MGVVSRVSQRVFVGCTVRALLDEAVVDEAVEILVDVLIGVSVGGVGVDISVNVPSRGRGDLRESDHDVSSWPRLFEKRYCL